jgi:hypothetical protein
MGLQELFMLTLILIGCKIQRKTSSKEGRNKMKIINHQLAAAAAVVHLRAVATELR